MTLRRATTGGILLALALGFAAAGRAASTTGKAPDKASPDELFDQPKVWVLKIDIPDAALEALKADPREYVKVTVRELETIHENVGLRIRGSKRFEFIELSPSLVLKFDEFVDGGGFHGHTRIFLGNAEADRSYLKKAIGSEIYRAANVPAPKINFARLTVNEQDQGLYLIEEAVNRAFLSAYFAKTKGNLYEGSKADVDERLEKDSGDRDKEQSDLKALAAAAGEVDPAGRWKRLETVLDLDQFLRFAAAEVFTTHRKGYLLGVNNYRVYHDPASDKMVFIPHDLDDLFERPQAPLLAEWRGLVARAVLDHPEGQRRFREQMRLLLATAFHAESLQGRVRKLAWTLRPLLPRSPEALREFDTATSQLAEQIAERARFVTEELDRLDKAAP